MTRTTAFLAALVLAISAGFAGIVAAAETAADAPPSPAGLAQSPAAPAAATLPETAPATDAGHGGIGARAAQSVASLSKIVRNGYDRAPALILVLGAVLLVPVVAIGGFAVHVALGRRRWSATERQYTSAPWPDEGPEDGPGEGDADVTERAVTVPVRTGAAWVSVEGKAAAPHPLDASLVRIGRHDDNDIRLPYSSVHRYHAVIHRTPEAHFVITDLTGRDGNGVVVNGERQIQARLASGDLIELGEARLKFECTPA